MHKTPTQRNLGHQKKKKENFWHLSVSGEIK